MLSGELRKTASEAAGTSDTGRVGNMANTITSINRQLNGPFDNEPAVLAGALGVERAVLHRLWV